MYNFLNIHGYRRLPDNGLLVAVADGAGSAERSAEGAQRAIAAILENLAMELAVQQPDTAALWHELLQRAFAAARTAVEQLAQQEQTSLRAFATMLPWRSSASSPNAPSY